MFSKKEPKEEKTVQSRKVEGVWVKAFLSALRDCANIREACRQADVDRATVYQLRGNDPEFKRLWDIALEDACDHLEARAREGALLGWEKLIVVNGQERIVREPKETLLMFLLRAHRKDVYGDTKGNKDGDGGGGAFDINLDGLTEEELLTLYALSKKSRERRRL
jgi:hypothetical protein